MYKLVLPLIFFSSALAANTLPPSFKRCSQNDPDLNNCLKIAISSALKEWTSETGPKHLQLPSIDPLNIKALNIDQGSEQAGLNLKFLNFSINGIKDVELESVDAQLSGDEKTLSCAIKTVESLILVGNYSASGQILILPITGTGNFKIELFGAAVNLILSGKTVVRNGKTFLAFTSVDFALEPLKVKLFFGNLFNGDKVLGDTMNDLLNDRWLEAYKELQDPIQRELGTTFIGIANHIFTKVPYDEIFLQ